MQESTKFKFLKSSKFSNFAELFFDFKFLGQCWYDMKFNRRVLLSTIAGGGLLGGALFNYAFFIEPYWIQVKKYTIASVNLPAAFDGMRIAFVSDTHYGSCCAYDLLEQTVQLVQEQSPDLILLGGDYCDNEDVEAIRRCFSVFKHFSAPLGVYGVLGNHDSERAKTLAAMREVKIRPMVNRSYWLMRNGSRILLGGLDDCWVGKPSFVPMQRKINDSHFTIIVSHNPDIADSLTKEQRNEIDLILSGHSHGGQLTFFGLYAPIRVVQKKFITGLVKPFKNSKVRVIISNGIGTSCVPLRFFAPPQLVVVTLKKIT
ncbi:MAG: metallophosphoesterase [Planctomycetaceae bacterium]|nr:metallophosphoesterase [Planctomycetaceae bacterium]